MKTKNEKFSHPIGSDGKRRNPIRIVTGLMTTLSLSYLLPTALFAQEADSEEIYELSPFTVDAENIGYRATSTLAGTRINTELKDIGSSISVFTDEFFEDVGATDTQDILIYGTSSEVGGTRGNFTGTGNGASLNENGLFVRPNNNTRLRGLDAADNTRNYFRSIIPMDTYNTSRVDMVRGANSILFGLGSPAGIINTTLKSADFADSNEVSLRFGGHGSLRASGNFNQELIEDEMAIRISLLKDETKFRQDPAYSDKTRVYIATRWDPKSLNSDSMATSFKISYENGSIDSNNPRMMTPRDQITPFFKSGSGIEGGLNQFTVNQYIGNFSGDTSGWATIDDVPQDIYNMPQALKGFDSQGNKIWGIGSNLGGNRNPWMKNMGSIFDEIVAYSNSNTPHDFQQAAYVSHAGGTISGAFLGRWQGPNNFADFARRAGLPNWDLGVYKDQHINDRSIFDYKNHLLEGPNKNEFNDFDGAQLTFSQTFFNGNLGYEVGFDRQESEWGQTTLFGGGSGNSAITIDINEVLPDGSPNPNVGRAVVTNTFTNGNNISAMEMDQLRATVFGKLDLQERLGENFLGKLLGSHTFTGFFGSDEDVFESRGYVRYGSPLAFAERLQGPTSLTSSMLRKVSIAHYLSGDLRGQSWPTGLSPIDQVVTPKSGGTANFFDPTWIATGVDTSAEWVDPFFPRAGPETQFDNPANYVGWTNGTIHLDGRDYGRYQRHVQLRSYDED